MKPETVTIIILSVEWLNVKQNLCCREKFQMIITRLDEIEKK